MGSMGVSRRRNENASSYDFSLYLFTRIHVHPTIQGVQSKVCTELGRVGQIGIERNAERSVPCPSNSPLVLTLFFLAYLLVALNAGGREGEREAEIGERQREGSIGGERERESSWNQDKSTRSESGHDANDAWLSPTRHWCS